MRDLFSYGVRDWMNAAPLVDGFRLLRNTAASRYFQSQRSPEVENFLSNYSSPGTETLTICIGFNTPWLIDLMIRAAKVNLTNARFVIVDNSNRAEARAEIKAICSRHRIDYMALPPNPVRHGSRSHGVALNWVFHNIVRQISPKTFAFLDHDLIPLCPADLGARVASQPVYGRFMHSHDAWFVWAGYCIYDFGSVSRVDLDFNIDKSRHLDTGGRNWLKLYRHLDAEKLELADTIEVTPVGQNPEESMFELMDEFMHLRGGAGAVGAGFAARKAIAEHLVDAIERRVPASTAMADVGLYAPMPSHKTIRPLPSSLEAPPNSHI